jgi:hypothetical protein
MKAADDVGCGLRLTGVANRLVQESSTGPVVYDTKACLTSSKGAKPGRNR